MTNFNILRALVCMVLAALAFLALGNGRVEAQETEGEGNQVVVQVGDTLGEISFFLGLPLGDLADCAGVENPDYIIAGEVLDYSSCQGADTVDVETAPVAETSTDTEEQYVSSSDNDSAPLAAAADTIPLPIASVTEEQNDIYTPVEEAPAPVEEAPAPMSSSGNAVVAEAYKYLGTPYVLGGEESCVPYQMMDCTCFTASVYAAFGVSLPDSPYGQMGYGSLVNGEPAAGDIVFYSEDGYNITHAALATGAGTVVHSSNFMGGVVETPIYDIPGYAGARRIV